MNILRYVYGYYAGTSSMPIVEARTFSGVVGQKVSGARGYNFSTKVANFRQNFDRKLPISDSEDYVCSKC